MQKRPVALLLASLLFLYFPAELVARAVSNYSITPFEIVIAGVLPVLLILGLLRVTKVGWYTLVAMVSLWGLHDLYLFYHARGENLVPLFAHLAIYALSIGYFINPRIRTLYFDPNLCWWKTKKRFETCSPLIVSIGKTWSYPILRNVSEGGCFIEMTNPPQMQTRISITIPLPIPLNVSVIRSEGEVRWVTNNPMRPGIGVQFKTDSPEQRKAIRQYVSHQL